MKIDVIFLKSGIAGKLSSWKACVLRVTKCYGLKTDLWPVPCDRHILRYQTLTDMHFQIICTNTIFVRNEPRSNMPIAAGGLLYEELWCTKL
jgi:hypothetical protein